LTRVNDYRKAVSLPITPQSLINFDTLVVPPPRTFVAQPVPSAMNSPTLAAPVAALRSGLACKTRPLEAAELPAALHLLREGFPLRDQTFWARAVANMRVHAGNSAAQHPLGFGLFEGSSMVGVALTPASLRRRADGSLSKLVNLSSWFIQPRHRYHAVFMLRHIMADPGATYLDLTPTPAVQKMLPSFGMTAVNAATAIYVLPFHAACPGPRCSVRPLIDDEAAPAVGPLPPLLAAHRRLGCVPLLVDHPLGTDLLVYRNIRVRHIPAAQMVYVPSHEVLNRHLGAVSRHLLRAGLGLMVCDSRVSGPDRWHTRYRARDIWYARGESFADRTDFLGSERCLMGV
jgi:hypothetical protein